MRRTAKFLSAIMFAALLGTTPAQAKIENYHVVLDGKSASVQTESKATGTASIALDRTTQTISMTLSVAGITIDNLWDKLVAAPVGPIHFHKYNYAPGGHEHGTNDVVLLMPIPFGTAYSATTQGFKVILKQFSIASAAALIGSKMTFDEFATALKSGSVILNIHTDTFNDGEISGIVNKKS